MCVVLGMCVGMCVDVCADMCIDTCADMCVHMCVGMFTGTRRPFATAPLESFRRDGSNEHRLAHTDVAENSLKIPEKNLFW